MNEDRNIIDEIITRLFLNEFLSKIIPGAILLTAMIPHLTSYRYFFYTENGVDRILFWGVSWIIGYLVEFLGYKLKISRHKLDEDLLKNQKQFERDKLQRLNALKNVFGNSFIAIILGYASILLISLISVTFFGFDYVSELFTLTAAPYLLLVIVLVILLRIMHVTFAKKQVNLIKEESDI